MTAWLCPYLFLPSLSGVHAGKVSSSGVLYVVELVVKSLVEAHANLKSMDRDD